MSNISLIVKVRITEQVSTIQYTVIVLLSSKTPMLIKVTAASPSGEI